METRENIIKDQDKMKEYLKKISKDDTYIKHMGKNESSLPIFVDTENFGCEEEDFWSYVEYLREHEER